MYYVKIAVRKTRVPLMCVLRNVVILAVAKLVAAMVASVFWC